MEVEGHGAAQGLRGLEPGYDGPFSEREAQMGGGRGPGDRGTRLAARLHGDQLELHLPIGEASGTELEAPAKGQERLCFDHPLAPVAELEVADPDRHERAGPELCALSLRDEERLLQAPFSSRTGLVEQ